MKVAIRITISFILFLISGVVSTYLYSTFFDDAGIFLPGLFYTSVTLIVFVINSISVKLKNMLLYYVLMNVLYVLIWFLTFLSSYCSFMVGIITAGVGAMLTFALTNKYISPISFKKLTVSLFGGAAFVLTLIVMWWPDTTIAEYFFKLKQEPYGLNLIFSDVFIFWHPIVGTVLVFTIQRTRNSMLLNNPSHLSPLNT